VRDYPGLEDLATEERRHVLLAPHLTPLAAARGVRTAVVWLASLAGLYGIPLRSSASRRHTHTGSSLEDRGHFMAARPLSSWRRVVAVLLIPLVLLAPSCSFAPPPAHSYHSAQGPRLAKAVLGLVFFLPITLAVDLAVPLLLLVIASLPGGGATAATAVPLPLGGEVFFTTGFLLPHMLEASPAFTRKGRRRAEKKKWRRSSTLRRNIRLQTEVYQALLAYQDALAVEAFARVPQ
jgi:hypothetical protein